MKRSGFSLVEVLMVIGIVGVVTGITIPLYRDYQISNDMDLAMEQVTQGLGRAKLLSQSGQQDSAWGFYVPAGVVYKGQNYLTRVQAADEVYPMPSTIAITGLKEVPFSKIKGIPSQTGAITLMGLNNEQRTVIVQVQKQNVEVLMGDNISICHTPPGNPAGKHTLVISDSAWPTYQAQGDTLGPCPVSSSVASSASSSASSVASSVASSTASSAASSAVSSLAPGGGGVSSSSAASSVATCSDRFAIEADGTIRTTGPLSIIFTSVGGTFKYGKGGPDVPVYLSYKKSKSSNTWLNLFSGNQVNGTGGATQTVSGFVNGDKLTLRIKGYYNQNNWLSYNRSVYSDDGLGDVKILRNGDLAPTYVSGDDNHHTSIVSPLISSYVVNGRISIGQYDLMVLANFDNSDCQNCTGDQEDYQEGIILVKFQAPSC